jgi:TatD DNase family protein
MLFDTHAHYNDSRFDEDREAFVAALPQLNVALALNPGSSVDNSVTALALAERFAHIYCAAGVHPHAAATVPGDYLDTLRGLLAAPKCVAVGEIGLDYHYDHSPRETQQRVFREQLELAVQAGKPVIIHSREALGDCLRILDEYPSARGVFHCFSEDAAAAVALAERGWYIGFAGYVTFKKSERQRAAAAAVPAGRLVIETDAPYMAPEPHRGKRCDSAMLPLILNTLARVRGESPEELEETTFRNGVELFGIQPRL